MAAFETGQPAPNRKGSAPAIRHEFRLSPEASGSLRELARLYHGGNLTAVIESYLLGVDQVPVLLKTADIATILSVHPRTVLRNAKAMGLQPIGSQGFARYPLAAFINRRRPFRRSRSNLIPPDVIQRSVDITGTL